MSVLECRLTRRAQLEWRTSGPTRPLYGPDAWKLQGFAMQRSARSGAGAAVLEAGNRPTTSTGIKD
jgi:hypothetical protein